MRIAGITAEYNPFHRGHERQIAEAKEKLGAAGVIVVMSGDFVQRGEAAVTDKYRRAEMALRGGADLVLELPPEAATGSAELFARGAVSMFTACGCVTDLVFGAETPDEELLSETARILREESGREVFRAALREGASYPRAIAEAAGFVLPESAEILSQPNNLLAVEYFRALSEPGCGIRPCPLPRRGQAYGESRLPAEGQASASAIRAALKAGDRRYREHVPDWVSDLLSPVVDTDDLSYPLAVRLALAGPGELEEYRDVSPELAARIRRQAPYMCSFSELAKAVSARNYTLARVKRALLHILLGIRKKDEMPQCLRVLGFRADSPLPALLKKTAAWPVIDRAGADKEGLGASLERAARIWRQAVYFGSGLALPEDYRERPVIVEDRA